MGAFFEFVRGFCLIAVAGGLALLVSPEGNLKKYVKFTISLCMVSALLSAFFTFSENAENIFSEIEFKTESETGKTEEELRFAVVKEAKRNMENEMRTLLSAHLGVAEEDVYIVLRIDAEDLSAVEISEINIFLSDISLADKARAYISEMFMGAVDINILQKGENRFEACNIGEKEICAVASLGGCGASACFLGVF